MALKLKLDGEGKPVLKNDQPVYVYDDGKEIIVDVEGMFTKISDLNTESKNHRLKARDFETKLESFGELDSSKAATMIKEFDEIGGVEGLAKLKKNAGVDVEAIKTQLTSVYEDKLAAKDKIVAEKDSDIRKLLVSNGFTSSTFVNDKLIIPADIVEATFGKHFKVEDGQVVAYMGENKILSREKPGEVAPLDEALAVIIDSYPMKDRILKSPGGGSGAPGGGGSGPSGEKTLSRAAFQALSPDAQMEHSISGGAVSD